MSEVELQGNIIRIPKETTESEEVIESPNLTDGFVISLKGEEPVEKNNTSQSSEFVLDLNEASVDEETESDEVMPTLPDDFYATEGVLHIESVPETTSPTPALPDPAEEIIDEVINFTPTSETVFGQSNPLNGGNLVRVKPKLSRKIRRKAKRQISSWQISWGDSKNKWHQVFESGNRKDWQSQMIKFTAVSIVCSVLVMGLSLVGRGLVVKQQVLGESVKATDNLKQAGTDLGNGNFDLAAAELATASFKFEDSLNEIENLSSSLNLILSNLPGKNPYKSAVNLLGAAQDLTQAASYIASGFSDFNNLAPILSDNAEEVSLDNSNTLTSSMAGLLDSLEKADDYLNSAASGLQASSASLLPKDYQKSFLEAQTESVNLQKSLAGIKSFVSEIMKFLGHDSKKRYLLTFQNHSEIRATGGFIGSLAVLDFDRGHVTKLEVEGIYDPAGQLVEKVTPPEPLRFMNPRWNIQDSNWLPDFPSSAEKIAWFYEKTGGPSVDGIISLTPEVIIELLKLTGPIPMPEYNTVIDANNFLYQTQREVELEYNREENKPKKFIGDMAPKLIDKILNGPDVKTQDLVRVLVDMTRRKQIVLASFDEAQQSFLEEYDLAGQQKTAPLDYLSVVNSNITGGKTDNLVNELINIRTIVEEDGEVINYVEITREHTGTWEWPSTKNLVYQRIYVPAGAELIEAKGFDKIYLPEKTEEEEHYQQDPDILAIESTKTLVKKSGTEVFRENGYTVFANWIGVEPGETKTVSYKYKLPFTLDLSTEGRYSVLIQKQLGSFSSEVKAKVYLPATWKIAYLYPEKSTDTEPGIVSLEDMLDRDIFFGFVFSGE